MKEIRGRKAAQNVWCRHMMEINGRKEQTKRSGSGHWEPKLIDESRKLGSAPIPSFTRKTKREQARSEERHWAQKLERKIVREA